MAIGMIADVVVDFSTRRLRAQDDKDGECEKGDLFHNKGFELGKWGGGCVGKEEGWS